MMSSERSSHTVILLWMILAISLSDAKPCYLKSQLKDGCLVWSLSSRRIFRCTSLTLGGFISSGSHDAVEVDHPLTTSSLLLVQELLQRNVTSGLSCPPNMVQQNCSCQGTCEDPHGCHGDCLEGVACVCPKGFLLNGTSCIPHQDCGCYYDGHVIPSGHTEEGHTCGSKCLCEKNRIKCTAHYVCDQHAYCLGFGSTQWCVCSYGYHGDGETCERMTDCGDWYRHNYTVDQVYQILPEGWVGDPVDVYCDMTNGGWTVIQRRDIGSNVTFYRAWTDYKNGFGDKNGDYWLGNDALHYITNKTAYTLHIYVTGQSGSYHKISTQFKVGPESANYQSLVASSWPIQYGLSFTTFDRDNDPCDVNCATLHQGAWWYGEICPPDCDGVTSCVPSYSTACPEACTSFNLNGDFPSYIYSSATCDVLTVTMKIKHFSE